MRRSLILSSTWPQIIVRSGHYLAEANPVRQPKDLVSCILGNIVHHDADVVVFNKPPGVMVLGKSDEREHSRGNFHHPSIADDTWDRTAETNEENEDGEVPASARSAPTTPCTIQYHMPQFRAALQWDHFFPCIRTPKSVSNLIQGIVVEKCHLHWPFLSRR